jgi:hypothetical protein
MSAKNRFGNMTESAAFQKSISTLVIINFLGILSGCGGTWVLKEPVAMQTTQPLATVSDQQITATLDWVIVRDGPGTWAHNADWDEYLLRVSNLSDGPIKVTRIIVVDSLNTQLESQPDRKKLVKGSKQTARRYKDSGIKVKAGRGAGTMLIAGAAVTVVGYSAAQGVAAAAYTSLLSGATVGAGTSAVIGGLVLLGPALAVGGVARAVNNSAVNGKIVLRQTVLPLNVFASEELTLDVFFPLAPSPEMVEVIYTDTNGENSLILDTRVALNGLHLTQEE